MRALLAAWLAIVSCTSAAASTLAPEPLKDLFAEADAVAQVRITGADSLGFRDSLAVCRAEVLDWYKSSDLRPVIFFGPCRGVRLGGEYVLFLRKTGHSIQGISALPQPPWPGAADEPVLKVEPSFGEFPIEYVCASRDSEGGPCDYAISAPSGVILPDNLPTYVQECDSRPYSDTWVKVAAFTALLRELGRDLLQTLALDRDAVQELVARRLLSEWQRRHPMQQGYCLRVEGTGRSESLAEPLTTDGWPVKAGSGCRGWKRQGGNDAQAEVLVGISAVRWRSADWAEIEGFCFHPSASAADSISTTFELRKRNGVWEILTVVPQVPAQ